MGLEGRDTPLELEGRVPPLGLEGRDTVVVVVVLVVLRAGRYTPLGLGVLEGRDTVVVVVVLEVDGVFTAGRFLTASGVR